MSQWFNIIGAIHVGTYCSNDEIDNEYILKKVLANLPVVSGSEGDMSVVLTPSMQVEHNDGYDIFDNKINNVPREYVKSMDIITVFGNLRDVSFDEGIRMFTHWLFQLAKNVIIRDISVTVTNGAEPKHHWYRSYTFKDEYVWYSKDDTITPIDSLLPAFVHYNSADETVTYNNRMVNGLKP